MTPDPADRRRAVAGLVRQLLADPGFAREFRAALRPGDEDDPLLDELVDLVWHLPPRSAAVGRSGSEARQRARLEALLAEAEA